MAKNTFAIHFTDRSLTIGQNDVVVFTVEGGFASFAHYSASSTIAVFSGGADAGQVGAVDAGQVGVDAGQVGFRDAGQVG